MDEDLSYSLSRRTVSGHRPAGSPMSNHRPANSSSANHRTGNISPANHRTEGSSPANHRTEGSSPANHRPGNSPQAGHKPVNSLVGQKLALETDDNILRAVNNPRYDDVYNIFPYKTSNCIHWVHILQEIYFDPPPGPPSPLTKEITCLKQHAYLLFCEGSQSSRS